MKLKKLLHIRENDVHIIGSLVPPFFFRVSNIMEEFIQLCDNKSIGTSLNLLKDKYSPTEFDNFQQRLDKIKDKLFENEDNADANKITHSSKVHILTLNITRKCNLKCDYCFEDSEYRKLGNMPFDVAKKAIDTFFTAPTNTPNWVIIFTGGEPLLNYDLLKKVVEYVHNKGLKVEYKIKTNATLMDNEKIDFLIKNNFKIQISLDGNKTAHDTHRKFANGKGCFKIVDTMIRTIINKNYSNVVISGTTTHQTINYINDSYANLNSYKGVPYDLKPVMPNSKDHCVLNNEDLKIAYHALVGNNKQLILKSKQVSDKNKNICGIGIWNITIDVNGEIYPCYRMCGDEKYVLGTLESFAIPFKLPQELENIYRLENNKKCSECFFVNVCKKGCYTDKIAYRYEIDECFLPTKQIVMDILYNNFVINESYKLLYVI